MHVRLSPQQYVDAYRDLLFQALQTTFMPSLDKEKKSNKKKVQGDLTDLFTKMTAIMAHVATNHAVVFRR